MWTATGHAGESLEVELAMRAAGEMHVKTLAARRFVSPGSSIAWTTSISRDGIEQVRCEGNVGKRIGPMLKEE